MPPPEHARRGNKFVLLGTSFSILCMLAKAILVSPKGINGRPLLRCGYESALIVNEPDTDVGHMAYDIGCFIRDEYVVNIALHNSRGGNSV